MRDLSDKNILVLGASSVIARQTIKLLQSANSNLFLVSRKSADFFNDIFDKNFRKIVFIEGNISNTQDHEKIINKMPQLNGLVCAVGVYSLKPIRFISEQDLIETFQPTVFGPMLFVASLLRQRKIDEGASLVFLSSVITYYPRLGCSVYAASKGAIEAFVKTLALELAPQRIRANCILPAFVKSPMLEQTRLIIGNKTIEEIEKIQPLGLGEPEDIAKTIVFLLSSESKWITGTMLKMGMY